MDEPRFVESAQGVHTVLSPGSCQTARLWPPTKACWSSTHPTRARSPRRSRPTRGVSRLSRFAGSSAATTTATISCISAPSRRRPSSSVTLVTVTTLLSSARASAPTSAATAPSYARVRQRAHRPTKPHLLGRPDALFGRSRGCAWAPRPRPHHRRYGLWLPAERLAVVADLLFAASSRRPQRPPGRLDRRAGRLADRGPRHRRARPRADQRTRRDLGAMRDYLTAVRDAVRPYARDGLPLDRALAEVHLHGYDAWPHPEHLAQAVERATPN